MGPIRQIAESATHSKISACSGLKPKVSASLAFAQRGPVRMARRTEVDRMFLILAALLFQLPIFAHPAIASASGAVENPSTAAEAVAGHPESPKGPQIVDAGVESQAAEPKVLADGAEAEVAIAFLPGRVVPEPVTPAMTSPMALAASPAPATPTPIVYVYSSPGKIHPDRRTRRIWLGLSIAQHSGAAFDAWSTRRVLSERNAQELNPTLRPFAGNASLYAAVQVGPTIFDYLSRRMMTSTHGWVRHTWWIPQTMSAAVSIASGVHNLGVYNAH